MCEDTYTKIVSPFLEDIFADIETILKGISLLGELTPKIQDTLLSFGEICSSFIISHAFGENLPVRLLDARTCIQTDSSFGQANVQFLETNNRLQRELENIDICIMGGFIGANAAGETTTL